MMELPEATAIAALIDATALAIDNDAYSVAHRLAAGLA
jgi:hypothetical protein